MIRTDDAFASKRAVAALSAGLMAALMSTSAWAQCVGPGVRNTGITNLGIVSSPSAALAGSLASSIANVSTSFLTQQGSAFVSAPANPAPDQPGGGIWVRGVGGEVTVKSNTNGTATATVPQNPALNTTVNINCATSSIRSTFEGAQVGADIARLNWNGWNVHLGTTAGYLGSTSRDSQSGFRNSFEVPFLGTYLVATYGRFFADVLVRQEYYNIGVNNPANGFFNQSVSAQGYSISTSAGYNFALQNNWFIEPSAGFNFSRTKVDSSVTTAPVIGISTLASLNDIESKLGRLSVRVGTVIATPSVVWQPFASVSVFHEFAGNVIGNAATLPNNAFVGALPLSIAGQTSTSRVGTYGQYSLGLAGQIVNTGWLGFVRGDYRSGNNIEGWTGNAGLRYQFSPDAVAAVMPVKVPVKARPFIGPTNWTGFYIGGFFGGDAGRTDIAFVGQTNDARPWVFGPIGGGQIGYNWQGATPWVFGVEGDIGAASIKGARQCGTDPGLLANGTPSGALASAYFTCRDKTDWVATATARVGYSYNRTLYYVRGGAAWEEASVSANCVLGPTGQAGVNANPPPAFVRACNNQAGMVQTNINTGSYTRTGWLIGFGTEFDLGRNWSAKTEYNYIDFGRHTALASDGVSTLTDRSSTSQVKVGVNYRFAPGAVIAKY